MSEIEKLKEFVNELNNIEELIYDSVVNLNHGEVPIWVAKKQIVGIEKNCKITKLDPLYLKENPYIKNIHIEDWVIGNIYLQNMDVYEENGVYVYKMRERDQKSLTTVYNLAYFPENVRTPALGTIVPYTKWMGVDISEITSFEPFIKCAHGKVLLMGCGLAYVAYMLSLKNDVEKVTVVELDKDIKKMFETYLKSQMNNKIEVIEGDALEFLEVEDISKYDYCSVDIWHGAMDMFPIYLKCLLLEEKHEGVKFHYWMEEDLHNILEKMWLIILEKRFDKELLDDDLKIFVDILDSQNVNTVEDLRKFLQTPKREILTEWALSNQDLACKQKKLDIIFDKVVRL